jgi:hypothetical protein
MEYVDLLRRPEKLSLVALDLVHSKQNECATRLGSSQVRRTPSPDANQSNTASSSCVLPLELHAARHQEASEAPAVLFNGTLQQ